MSKWDQTDSWREILPYAWTRSIAPFKLNLVLKIGFKGDLNNWRKIFTTAQKFIFLPGTDLTTIITLISRDTIFSAYALFLFENISTIYININHSFRRKYILK